MNEFAGTLARLLLMPPLNMLALLALGLLLRRRWPRVGKGLALAAAAGLYLLSTNAGALLLVNPLEARTAPLDYRQPSGAGAIVVLGASSIENAPEYGGLDVPDPVALVRLQYAAHLRHATGLPILASGGAARGEDSDAVAASMARALREDFRTEVAWTEERSSDTEQNAAYSAAILKQAGVRRILLVTHAMHMPRAREAFVRYGIEVVDAPTLFYSRQRWSPWMLLPSASGLYRSYYALHEWIGLGWYRWRARSS